MSPQHPSMYEAHCIPATSVWAGEEGIKQGLKSWASNNVLVRWLVRALLQCKGNCTTPVLSLLCT